MKDFRLENFSYNVICETIPVDTDVGFDIRDNLMSVCIKAENDRPKFIKIKWNFETAEDLYILGDAWERSYGDLEFRKLSENSRAMPWYFAAIAI